MLVEYHPSHLRPSEEELRRSEEARRKGDEAARKRKLDTELQRARNKQRVGDVLTPRGGGKKKMDASAAPCHGVVYHGTCNKEGCNFDHDPGRCAAFKEKHPDGPPQREKK